jgi:hypothetical protein
MGMVRCPGIKDSGFIFLAQAMQLHTILNKYLAGIPLKRSMDLSYTEFLGTGYC